MPAKSVPTPLTCLAFMDCAIRTSHRIFEYQNGRTIACDFEHVIGWLLHPTEWRRADVVKIKSNQKLFTEEEVSRLTGICLEHLHSLARSKHLGFLARAAEAAGEQAEKWLFTNSDLMVLAVLYPRCQH